jgi:hypothetical protein
MPLYHGKYTDKVAEVQEDIKKIADLDIDRDIAAKVIHMRQWFSPWEKDRYLPGVDEASIVAHNTRLSYFDVLRAFEFAGLPPAETAARLVPRNKERLVAEEIERKKSVSERMRSEPSMRMAGDASSVISDAYSELRSIGSAVASGVALQPGRHGINAGLLTEAMLASPMAQKLIQLEDDRLRGALAIGLSAPAEAPSSSTIKEALSLYGRPNGLIAHYRHGSADPASFTQNGMFVYAPDENSNLYRVENPSATRYLADGYQGLQRGDTETYTYANLLNAIEFRKQKGWYSNFVDPGMPQSEPLPRLEYQGANDIIGWDQHILKNGSSEDIARMREIQFRRQRQS